MKKIRVKAIKKITEDAGPVVLGRSEEEARMLKQRAINLSRLAKEARKAAKEEAAKQDGNKDLVDALNKRADSLDELVKNINIDTIDDDPISSSGDGNSQSDSNGKDANKKGDQQDNKNGTGNQKGDQQSKGNQSSQNGNNQQNGQQDNSQGDQQSQGQGQQNGQNGDDWKVDFDHSADDAANGSQSANGKESGQQDANGSSNQSGGQGQSSQQGNQNQSNQQGGQQGGQSNQQDGQQSQQSGQNGQGQQDGDQDDNDDDSQSNSNSAPVKDPFADDEDIPQQPSFGSVEPQEPREPTIDEIIKQLQGLKGKAKEGAVAGLKDLLKKAKSKKESLTESKGIRDMSDDEFGDLVNDTLDMIEKVRQVKKIDDLADRKARIDKWKNNRKALDDLEWELAQNAGMEKQKQVKNQNEIEKYRQFHTLKDFEIDFYNMINSQVEFMLKTELTYDEIDPETESEDIIMKAETLRQIPDEAKPIVDVFFDRSSSWHESDTEIGKKAIATIREDFVDTGLVYVNMWYFDNYVTDNKNDSSLGRGTTYAWKDILKTIKRNGSTNVVIMTDSDMNDRGAESSETVMVEGRVWFLWRQGKCAPNCVKKLVGKEGNFQAAFYPGQD